MFQPSPSAAGRLLGLFERLRRFTFGQHPLQDSPVSMAQLTLLEWVAASPASGVQQMAEGLGLSAPTVSVTVRRLEEAGWLQRQAHPQDARAVQISLTAQGQALYQRARAFQCNKMLRLLAGLTAEESDTLLALLEKAIHAAETSDVRHGENKTIGEES